MEMSGCGSQSYLTEPEFDASFACQIGITSGAYHIALVVDAECHAGRK
jgi:hypothetical protein